MSDYVYPIKKRIEDKPQKENYIKKRKQNMKKQIYRYLKKGKSPCLQIHVCMIMPYLTVKKLMLDPHEIIEHNSAQIVFSISMMK